MRRILRLERGQAARRDEGTAASPPARQKAPQPGIPGSSGPVLAGRTALIAGAGPNIGRGIAIELAHAGAALVLVDCVEDHLVALRDELVAFGAAVTTRLCDLTVPGQVDDLVAWLEAQGPAIDLVVLNAGARERAAPGDSPDFREMEHVFRTNVIGPLYLAERLAQGMISGARAGSLVFISSIHREVPLRLPVYSASKAAIVMIVRELALQFAPHGIRVNAVAPGWVALDADAMPRPHRATPLHQRSVHPGFIGAAVVHLAAESLSGETTGATLTVDGGLSLHSYLTVPRA
jgi:NAD(P)-dependent dehydrogenase (short-subunit alcohol dehydrogenase family)